MKTLIFVLSLSLLFSLTVSAQVDAIKSASASKSESRSSRSSSSSSSSSYSDSGVSGDGVVAFFELTFKGIAACAVWQEHRLEKKAANPSIVSFDVMLQVGGQPSSYYIVNPRIRGNWGVFSTDFRFNYLIEEDIEGPKHIRTDDWQILELNIVNAKNFTGRIGGGIMHENFSGGKTFSEWTVAANVISNNRKVGGMTEFRWAEVRTEVSAQLQYELFAVRSLHTYATAGVVFQKYYSEINVWGIQGGLMMRIF